VPSERPPLELVYSDIRSGSQGKCEEDGGKGKERDPLYVTLPGNTCDRDGSNACSCVTRAQHNKTKMYKQCRGIEENKIPKASCAVESQTDRGMCKDVIERELVPRKTMTNGCPGHSQLDLLHNPNQP
jgi:hypothetical protein